MAEADGEHGFAAADLVCALQNLSGDDRPIGLVYGAGFEDRPQILAELARHWPVFGNLPEVVRRAKQPDVLARVCDELSIPHPEISRDPPRDLEHWLIKRQGGGGGYHIFPARDRAPGALDEGEYYQRKVEGTQVSVLVLADGRRAEILGLSAQWAAPCAARMFRFGGAVRPAYPDPLCSSQLCNAAQRIAGAFALRGLNSIDFLVDRERLHLLEVNPRPGATLDIFEDVDGRMLPAHIEACCGVLPHEPLVFARACASSIAYAPEALPFMPEIDWPDWCHDRQKPATHVARDAPICSIVAEADMPSAACREVEERLADFLRDVMSKASKLVAT